MKARWRVIACASGLLLVASSVGPALAETPAPAEVQGIPETLQTDLSPLEEQQLTAVTSGDGVPLAAFVTTPDGPEIVTLTAGSRADAAAAAALLDAQPSVQAADVSVLFRPTGAVFADQQYGNTMVRSVAARGGVDNPLSDVVVAVLDTGVHAHPELAGALVPGQNFTDSPGGTLDTTDRHGHGTHVAGTVAADADSLVEGIAYGAKVLPVKVLGDSGPGYSHWVASGIIWAADNGADVINMSLGSRSESSVLASAVDYARGKGVTVIAAAGNNNSSVPVYPAAYPGVIAVSAVDQAEAKASFSNFGSFVDVAAPGVGILSTYHDNGLASLSGTSMAAPHAAGVAALVEGAAPRLTPQQVEDVLVASVTDLGAPGRDDVFGHGLVDAERAVRAANQLEGTGTLPPRATAPGAPAIGTVSAGQAAATVRWAAPAGDGGSAITGYTVHTYRDGGLVQTGTAAAGTTSLTMTGLANGRPHTFTVTAVNDVGPGPASAPSAAVVPAPRTGSRFYLTDSLEGGQANKELSYGDPGDTVLVADTDGANGDSLLIRRGNRYFVRNSLTTGTAEYTFFYGDPGDTVLVGDWNGDGVDTLAIRRGNTYYIKNSTTTGVADQVITYGNPGDTVLVGDWNNDGSDTLAVRRGNQYFLKNSMTTGNADQVITYGDPGDTVLVGRWKNDTTGLAVQRNTTFYFKFDLNTGTHDLKTNYGDPGDVVLVGDWNGDGGDSLGVRRIEG